MYSQSQFGNSLFSLLLYLHLEMLFCLFHSSLSALSVQTLHHLSIDVVGFLFCSYCCPFSFYCFCCFVLTVKALAICHTSISITAMPTAPLGLDPSGPPWIHLSVFPSTCPCFLLLLPPLQCLLPFHHGRL